jgi:hypothetical protein
LKSMNFRRGRRQLRGTAGAQPTQSAAQPTQSAAQPTQTASRLGGVRQDILRRLSPMLRVHLARSKGLRAIDHFVFRPTAALRSLLCSCSREELREFVNIVVSEHKPALLEALQTGRLFANGRDAYVFVSHSFPTTWMPLVRALNARGNRTLWCGIDNPQQVMGYGALESRLVPTTEHAHMTFLGVIVFLCATRGSQILMSGECFYNANWNADDATVLYSLLSCVLTIMRRRRPVANNLNLLMYDGLKPINISGSARNAAITHYYKRLMNLGDRIIYNSNTELLGSFNRYVIPLPTPRLHFYRYSEAPIDPAPRIDLKGGKNIHLACITVTLNEFAEPSRDQAAGYVRDIVRSGIHFHYYCVTEDPAVLKFKRDLGDYAEFLHLHPIIKDQRRLVEELHQYHVGFNPSDHLPFAHGMVSLRDRFYQDAMAVFLQSTIGTSFLVYAAAGLPVLLPRCCVGAAQLLGDVAIPVSFAEMGNLRTVLEECDLERRIELAEANRGVAHIDTHIDRFIDFLRQ